MGPPDAGRAPLTSPPTEFREERARRSSTAKNKDSQVGIDVPAKKRGSRVGIDDFRAKNKDSTVGIEDFKAKNRDTSAISKESRIGMDLNAKNKDSRVGIDDFKAKNKDSSVRTDDLNTRKDSGYNNKDTRVGNDATNTRNKDVRVANNGLRNDDAPSARIIIKESSGVNGKNIPGNSRDVKRDLPPTSISSRPWNSSTATLKSTLNDAGLPPYRLVEDSSRRSSVPELNDGTLRKISGLDASRRTSVSGLKHDASLNSSGSKDGDLSQRSSISGIKNGDLSRRSSVSGFEETDASRRTSFSDTKGINSRRSSFSDTKGIDSRHFAALGFKDVDNSKDSSRSSELKYSVPSKTLQKHESMDIDIVSAPSDISRSSSAGLDINANISGSSEPRIRKAIKWNPKSAGSYKHEIASATIIPEIDTLVIELNGSEHSDMVIDIVNDGTYIPDIEMKVLDNTAVASSLIYDSGLMPMDVDSVEVSQKIASKTSPLHVTAMPTSQKKRKQTPSPLDLQDSTQIVKDTKEDKHGIEAVLPPVTKRAKTLSPLKPLTVSKKSSPLKAKAVSLSRRGSIKKNIIQGEITPISFDSPTRPQNKIVVNMKINNKDAKPHSVKKVKTLADIKFKSSSKIQTAELVKKWADVASRGLLVDISLSPEALDFPLFVSFPIDISQKTVVSKPAYLEERKNVCLSSI